MKLNVNRGWIIPSAVLFIVIAQVLTVREGHNWGGDFAQYILHARNIVEGRPYAQTGYIYNPSNPFLAPPTYPPVFPMLLAGVYALWGLNLTAMKALCIIFFGATLLAVSACLADRMSPARRLVVVLALGLNPFIWAFKDNILSEHVFTFFLFTGLWVLHRSARSVEGRSIGRAVVGGLLLGVACATRSVGLAALVSVAVAKGGRRKIPRRHVLAALVTAAALLLVENLLVHSDSRYLDQLAVYFGGPDPILGLARFKLSSWSAGWCSMWGGSLPTPWDGWSGGAVLLFVVLGFVLQVRMNGWSVFEVFTLCYLVGVFLWPMGQDPRFLLPVLPLLVAFATNGVCRAFALLRGLPARAVATAAVLLILFGGYAARYLDSDRGPIQPGISGAGAVGLFDFVRGQTHEDDVFIFIKPRVLALFTGRRSAAYHIDAPTLWRFVETIGATYLVAARWSAEDSSWLAGFVQRHLDRLKPVYQGADGDHVVYRIRLR